MRSVVPAGSLGSFCELAVLVEFRFAVVEFL